MDQIKQLTKKILTNQPTNQNNQQMKQINQLTEENNQLPNQPK